MANKKQEIFINEYLKCWNSSEAARRAGYRGKSNVIGPRLLADVGIKAIIRARLDEAHMSADEALKLLADSARANLANYFKIQEEWVRWPLPTQEILGEKEVEEPQEGDKPPKRYIMYWVRRICLDLDKLVDPNYARLVDEFSDSPKNGLSIKLAKKSDVIDKILRAHGVYKDNVDVTSGGKAITFIVEREDAKDDKPVSETA